MNLKEDIQKNRLKLTACALRAYHERYMKGDVETPLSVLEDCMLTSPKDADRIAAAKELVRFLYQKAPTESEVIIQEDKPAWERDKAEIHAELLSFLKDVQVSQASKEEVKEEVKEVSEEVSVKEEALHEEE